jgi:hypothetical protein
MIFSTKMASTLEKGDVSYIEAGIHENGSLEGAKKEKSTNGNTFIEITLVKDGRKLTHTEWEPTKFGDQSDEDFQLKITKQIARLLQILECFYPKEVLSNFEGATFDALADWVVSLLNSADKKIMLRFKAVYGRNGYVGLPQYSKYTFIEKMDVATSKISRLKIDLFERPEMDQKNNEITSTDYFASKSTSEGIVSDIPF